jgi:hypothetical protein
VHTGTRTGRAIVAATCLATVAGCAPVTRVADGRYVSPKGYGVVAPPAAWTVVPEGEADVEWRRTSPPGRMLVNGSCEDGSPRRPLGVLARQLLMGVRNRTVIERGEVTIGGRTARHVVLEGRDADESDPVRVEAYVLKDERCVYDFLYAAPVGSFEASRPEFRRVVDSFTMK